MPCWANRREWKNEEVGRHTERGSQIHKASKN